MIGEKGADMIKGYKRSPVKVRPGGMKMPKKLVKAMDEMKRRPPQTPIKQMFTHLKSKFGLKEQFNEIIHRRSFLRKFI